MNYQLFLSTVLIMSLGKPTTLGKSVLHHISMQSWRRGIANFYSESIPFSFSTGKEYAKFCLQLFSTAGFIKKNPTILEIGAGNGVFGKNFLEHANKEPFNCNYILSESEPAMVHAFDQLKGLQRHKNIEKKVIDLTQLSLDKHVDIMILNYVFDTFPVYNLEFHNSVLYEWLVTVNVKETAALTFFDGQELITWNNKDIHSWLCQDIFSVDSLPLLSRVYSCLDIKWEKRQANMDIIDSRGIIKRWIKDQPGESRGFFNFAPKWWNVLDQFVDISSENSMLLCYDLASYCVDNCSKQEQSFGRFGACMFYNIPFFLFDYYAQENNLNWVSSTYKNSENQIGCFLKTKRKNALSALVDFFKQDEPGKVTYQCWNNLKLLSSAQDCKTFIADVELALTSEQQSDYVWLFTVARTFFDCDEFNKALLVVDQIIDQYEFMALNALVLKSKILRKLDRNEEALCIVNTALKTIKNYDLLQLEKVFICGDLKDRKQCAEAIKEYLMVAGKDPQWHLLEAYQKLNR